MRTIEDLFSALLLDLGEETLRAELEGIRRKHLGIRTRQRKTGRVGRCAREILVFPDRTGEPPARLVARRAMERNLSQASVYRLVGELNRQGNPVRGVAVLREMKRIRDGIL
jgi:hypothetical protein